MGVEARLSTLVRHVRAQEEEDLRDRRPSQMVSARQCVGNVPPKLLQCSRITPDVGAEVVGANLGDAHCNPELVAAVDAALLEHKVLMFRGQHGMDSAKQLALIRALNNYWGLRADSPQQQASYEDGAFVIRMLPSKPGSNATIWPVSSLSGSLANAEAPLDAAANQQGKGGRCVRHHWRYHEILERRPPRASGGPMARFALEHGGWGNWTRFAHEATRATNAWHADDNYVLEPPWVTALHALEVPSCGGDTVFSDMSLALADMSENTSTFLRSLAGIADWRPTFPHYRSDSEPYKRLRDLYPLVAHPLVRTHPVTGRDVLFCNSIYTIGLREWSLFDDGQIGLGSKPPHADQLLRELLTLPAVPEYQCRMRWHGPGDMLLWDNRIVQHYAVADYGNQTRRMEHCASLGTVPYLDPGSKTSASPTSRPITSQLLPVGAELTDF